MEKVVFSGFTLIGIDKISNLLEGKEGDELEFDKVMLIDNDGKVLIGTPFLKNALVTAKKNIN